MTLLKQYTDNLEPIRAEIVDDGRMKSMVNPTLDPQVFLRFMIEFCSRGVSITEPVEGWIERAGHRTQETGLQQVGEQLVKHAKHEGGHHLMQIDDTKALVRRYNSLFGTALDAEALINRDLKGAAIEYVDLHEEVIASEEPFRQVAIEREIEGLSVLLGPSVVAQCARVLGTENLGEVSFLTEHVEIDVGHTAFNEKLVGRLLDAKPDALLSMIDVAGRALHIYRRFLTECLETAEQEVMGAWPTDAPEAAVLPVEGVQRNQVPLT